MLLIDLHGDLAADFNKVFGQYSFPLQMKSPLRFRLKKRRFEAADVPRVITVLVPSLGNETTTEIAREALVTGRGVYDLVCDRGLMTRDQLDRLLNPESMTAPRATPATDG